MDFAKYRKLMEADDEIQSNTSKDENDSVDPEFKAIVDKLRDIESYEQFVNALDKLNAQQQALFRDNFGKVYPIESVQCSAVDIPVKKLLPTQNQVAAWNSLDRNLGVDCSKFFDDVPDMGPDGILTYSKKYIIDGHHRWSQIFAFNPDAKIKCYNFSYPQQTPITNILKDFQAGVMASTKFILKGGEGVNLFTVSKDQIRKYIEDRIKEPCWQSIVKAGKATDEQTAIDYLVNNILLLQKLCASHASKMPERQFMPQTSSSTAKVLAKGITDMSESLDDDIKDLFHYL